MVSFFLWNSKLGIRLLNLVMSYHELQKGSNLPSIELRIRIEKNPGPCCLLNNCLHQVAELI